MIITYHNTSDFWKKVTIVSLLSALMIVTMHTINNVSVKYEHSPITDVVLQYIHWITHNAVKLFWMLSALLFYRDYTCGKIMYKYKSRFTSLVIPYLSWNVISMLLFGIIGFVPALKAQLNSLEPFTLNAENVFLGLFHHKYNMIFWFIFELILLVALAPIIYKLLKNKITGVISLMLFYILTPYIFSSSIVIRGGYSWIFYLIAAYVGIHWFDKIWIKINPILSACCLMGVVLLNSLQMAYADSRLISDLLTLLSCALIWFGMDCLLKYYRIWMVGISMFVFAIHFNIDMIVSKLIVRLIPDVPEIASIPFLLAWFTTIGLSVLIALSIKKYIPKLYALLNGGR